MEKDVDTGEHVFNFKTVVEGQLLGITLLEMLEVVRIIVKVYL
jgi:hypothetical protein